MRRVYTPHIEREVWLREGTNDAQVWADTFSGRYHLPPEEMPEPKTVLDLGANIGLTAAHYRYLWPEAKIVAVEMDAANADVARQNAPGATVRHAAVSGVPGFGSYGRDAETDAYALERVSLAPEELASSVYCVALAELIEKEFGGPVDFVKMDVEGEEWNLFERVDGWAPLVRNLLVELHEGSRGDAIRLLGHAGFRARAHPPHPSAVYAWNP